MYYMYYIIRCRGPAGREAVRGRNKGRTPRAISSVWLERLLDTQEVTGSIPASPTEIRDYFSVPPQSPGCLWNQKRIQG